MIDDPATLAADPLYLTTLASRMQMRVVAMIERDGSVEAAVTGTGIGIGFLLVGEIVDGLTAAATRVAELERERDQLIGKACLLCGKPKPCGLECCTFDPSPIDAARLFLARAEAAEAALAQARAALEPFATFSVGFGRRAREDGWVLVTSLSGTRKITMGDVRRAEDVLAALARPAPAAEGGDHG